MGLDFDSDTNHDFKVRNSTLDTITDALQKIRN